jgi:hypothetical protein
MFAAVTNDAHQRLEFHGFSSTRMSFALPWTGRFGQVRSPIPALTLFGPALQTGACSLPVLTPETAERGGKKNSMTSQR